MSLSPPQATQDYAATDGRFYGMDLNHDGVISLSEFRTAMQGTSNAMHRGTTYSAPAPMAEPVASVRLPSAPMALPELMPTYTLAAPQSTFPQPMPRACMTETGPSSGFMYGGGLPDSGRTVLRHRSYSPPKLVQPAYMAQSRTLPTVGHLNTYRSPPVPASYQHAPLPTSYGMPSPVGVGRQISGIPSGPPSVYASHAVPLTQMSSAPPAPAYVSQPLTMPPPNFQQLMSGRSLGNTMSTMPSLVSMTARQQSVPGPVMYSAPQFVQYPPSSLPSPSTYSVIEPTAATFCDAFTTTPILAPMGAALADKDAQIQELQQKLQSSGLEIADLKRQLLSRDQSPVGKPFEASRRLHPQERASAGQLAGSSVLRPITQPLARAPNVAPTADASCASNLGRGVSQLSSGVNQLASFGPRSDDPQDTLGPGQTRELKLEQAAQPQLAPQAQDRRPRPGTNGAAGTSVHRSASARLQGRPIFGTEGAPAEPDPLSAPASPQSDAALDPIDARIQQYLMDHPDYPCDVQKMKKGWYTFGKKKVFIKITGKNSDRFVAKIGGGFVALDAFMDDHYA